MKGHAAEVLTPVSVQTPELTEQIKHVVCIVLLLIAKTRRQNGLKVTRTASVRVENANSTRSSVPEVVKTTAKSSNAVVRLNVSAVHQRLCHRHHHRPQSPYPLFQRIKYLSIPMLEGKQAAKLLALSLV